MPRQVRYLPPARFERALHARHVGDGRQERVQELLAVERDGGCGLPEGRARERRGTRRPASGRCSCNRDAAGESCRSELVSRLWETGSSRPWFPENRKNDSATVWQTVADKRSMEYVSGQSGRGSGHFGPSLGSIGAAFLEIPRAFFRLPFPPLPPFWDESPPPHPQLWWLPARLETDWLINDKRSQFCQCAVRGW